MPDFEPIYRSLQEELAQTTQAKAEVKAYWRGVDHARKEIAIIIAVLGLIAIAICYVAIVP